MHDCYGAQRGFPGLKAAGNIHNQGSLMAAIINHGQRM